MAAACNLPASQNQIATAVAATVRALELSAPTLPPPSATPQPPTSTPFSTPTPASTSTPAAPRIRVSENTNCRAGPAVGYDFLGALLVGQVAEVAARSSVPNYWYIHNPDRPGEFCWLWGEFATLEGDPGALPAYTPAPSPTPSIDFILYLNSFQPCGADTQVVFTIQNISGTTFMTGQIHIFNLTNSTDIYGPLLDRHPFDPAAPDLDAMCRAVERRIVELGGLDLVMLGLGPNGHLASNEPGSAFGSRARAVVLRPETVAYILTDERADPRVSHRAVTLGLGTLAEAREVVVLVSGAPKREALRRALTGPVTPDCPASLLQTCTCASTTGIGPAGTWAFPAQEESASAAGPTPSEHAERARVERKSRRLIACLLPWSIRRRPGHRSRTSRLRQCPWP